MPTDPASELSELMATLASVEAVLNPDAMRKEADSLRDRSADPSLWEDQDQAQEVTRRLSYLDAELARLEGDLITPTRHRFVDLSSREEREAAVGLLARGLVTSKGIVTHGFTLEQWDEAIKVANSLDSIKVLLKPKT